MFPSYINLMARNKGGRPPVPEEERRSVTRTFRVTSAESDLIDEAAVTEGVQTATFMRAAVLRAAQRATKGGS